jgi:hypothetical protein
LGFSDRALKLCLHSYLGRGQSQAKNKESCPDWAPQNQNLRGTHKFRQPTWGKSGIILETITLATNMLRASPKNALSAPRWTGSLWRPSVDTYCVESEGWQCSSPTLDAIACCLWCVFADHVPSNVFLDACVWDVLTVWKAQQFILLGSLVFSVRTWTHPNTSHFLSCNKQWHTFD